jgi:hypothetical protein
VVVHRNLRLGCTEAVGNSLWFVGVAMARSVFERISYRGGTREPQVRDQARKRRRRRLLVTTDTDEKAMAAAAIMGSKKPRAARGIAATL